ncbi:MAG TPA: helix-turn-helix domain-containing protein [Myxococcales bacterium]
MRDSLDERRHFFDRRRDDRRRAADAAGSPTPEPQAGPDVLWDARDVARFLRVHRNWVYLNAEAGTIPCVRVGGVLRFEPGTIRAIGKGQPVKGGRVVAVPVARNRIDRK